MGTVRKEYREMEREDEQVQHLDRVSWYTALIQEWTTQMPQMAIIDEQTVAVWIGPYSSVFGVRHRTATQVWARSVEAGLECLCNWVYEDVPRVAQRVGLCEFGRSCRVHSRCD